MSGRKELDGPATTIAAVAGLLIIAGSAWALPMLYCQSPDATCSQAPAGSTLTFDISWFSTVAPNGAGTVTANDASPQASMTLHPGSILHAGGRVKIAAGDCKDVYDSRYQNPATLTLTITSKQAGLADASAVAKNVHCADAASGFTMTLDPPAHPKNATVGGANMSDARAALWTSVGKGNSTVEYLLTVSWTRPPSSVPVPPGLPVGQTSMTVQATLEVDEWGATLSPAKVPEAGK